MGRPLGSPLRVLSLGWGVQSFTLAAMSALGELPPLDLAIPSDTTHERPATYAFQREWTQWLIAHGVPTIGVRPRHGAPLIDKWGAVAIPAYSRTPRKGKPDKKGQVQRQCTQDWKIKPIRRQVRALMAERGIKVGPGRVEQWIGFSQDEWDRARTSDVQYIVNRHPLLERKMSRADCARWLLGHGLPIPPKSACIWCPYQSLRSWQELKRAGGAPWVEAVAVDADIRTRRKKVSVTLYLHPARVPLAEAVQIPEDHGFSQGDLFEDTTDGDCKTGVCFV